MATNKDKIISLQDVVVKFNVRGRMLTAIRNVSFDIYDGETVAIVGESGSGKSVLTKTLTNMLESNGYISNGTIMYFPTEESKNNSETAIREDVNLVNYHKGSLTSDTRKKIKKSNYKTINNAKIRLEALNARLGVKGVDTEDTLAKIKEESEIIHDAYYELSTFSRLRKRTVLRLTPTMKEISNKKSNLSLMKGRQILAGLRILAEQEFLTEFELNLKHVLEKLKNAETVEEHEVNTLLAAWKFQTTPTWLNKREAIKKLKQVRGGTIATIFQDPMTSLNPLLSVGFQISEAIRLHNKVSRHAAKQQAIELMNKVGIPNAEKRYHDIPGKYSGGMRQRIVIAIALACKPKVLICDEPTTALDVTIQAQILELIKELKKEFNLTVIFITHDLGVVANVADRVAVLYAGQIIEYGTVKDIFFDARHPYTWALLSSLPQLGTKGEELFAITGTPPSLFNKIKGDAFAPRNKFALAIDFEYNPPMFEISKTHGARTWLLDPRAPKVEKPKMLENLKEAVIEAKVGE
ncbi:ABC transporter ATP-binding protein [Mesoplasma entomophilum]|uniref:oligopeptide/dipeptide ABC transporter ATP-binding protein n=1 Tax=Mesoplasma entomophilum TaxID=2149 RepID=UPI000D025E82|nr:oligopeptide/dipeptide ABC transporter ATP-binding protein [Mesoplasma entomophilum]AVN60120.1 ABC transporter ATP-binding protein [Mesoplasma entomophilum]